MIVTINNNAYSMGYAQFGNVLRLAKDKYEREHENAIYAVEKGGTADMKRELFIDKKRLMKGILAYQNRGFTVHYTERGAT